MTRQCPPHTWSATPLKGERGKAIWECSKCGTYITGDCKSLTKAEVDTCAATAGSRSISKYGGRAQGRESDRQRQAVTHQVAG